MASRQQSRTCVVAATGVGQVDLTNRTNQTWALTQVSIRLAAAPLGSTAELQYNSVFVTALIATGDAAGGDPPVVLLPSDTVSVVWSGCTSGQIGTVLVFYDDGI